jgi:hypothetical protein
MPTVLTSSTPYCTAVLFTTFHDWRHAADLLADDDTRLADEATVQANTKLEKFLMVASGVVESACLVSGRYKPADLTALTGATQAILQQLVADLAFWLMTRRRWPDTKPQDVPGAGDALELLERLRLGERIFGLQEVADAGLATTTDMAPANSVYEVDRVSVQANRFFGVRRSER